MKILWKIYKYFAVTLITVLILDAFIVFSIGTFRPEIKKADAIVVLGAAINTPTLYNRSLQGLKMYEEGKGEVIVLSGGRISDKDISEAGYMQKSILSKAKEPVPLILEEDSHNTYENINNTKTKIGEGKSLLIVSDEYHLARAVLLAKRAGFSPVYWSSPVPFYYSKRELGMYYLREIIAMLDYIPKFIFG